MRGNIVDTGTKHGLLHTSPKRKRGTGVFSRLRFGLVCGSTGTELAGIMICMLWLAGKLNPAWGQVPAIAPRPVAPMELPPLAAKPEAWASSALGAIPGGAYLPTAITGTSGRAAETSRQRPLFARRSPDAAPLAWELGPYLPRPVFTPSGPLTYAATPDATRLAPPWRDTPPDPARPDLTADPVLGEARRASLAGVPELRQRAAAFLRLVIPDPFESLTAMRMQEVLPDADGPVATSDLPPKPFLPVAPPPAPKR